MNYEIKLSFTENKSLSYLLYCTTRLVLSIVLHYSSNFIWKFYLAFSFISDSGIYFWCWIPMWIRWVHVYVVALAAILVHSIWLPTVFLYTTGRYTLYTAITRIIWNCNLAIYNPSIDVSVWESLLACHPSPTASIILYPRLLLFVTLGFCHLSPTASVILYPRLLLSVTLGFCHPLLLSSPVTHGYCHPSPTATVISHPLLLSSATHGFCHLSLLSCHPSLLLCHPSLIITPVAVFMSPVAVTTSPFFPPSPSNHPSRLSLPPIF